MNKAKDIIYNCEHATFLIEKGQLAPLTFREKWELKLHLAGCSICKVFKQQSIFINRLVRHIFDANINNPKLKMDETFKQQLQERIEKKLKNKK